jgi:uncharacterized protein YdaU (DUF1376 family)
MSSRPWIKWYANDFLSGIAELSPHEIAVYTVVINRIYDEDGPVRDEPRKIARRCNMRLPQCEKALASLVESGKLSRENGCLANPRARKEIAKRQERNTKATRNINQRWQKEREKANENNDGSIRAYKNLARAHGKISEVRKKEEGEDAREDVSKVHDRVAEICGADVVKSPTWMTLGTVRLWLERGFDPERDIYPTVEDVMRCRSDPDPPRSPNYFTSAIERAHQNRTLELPKFLDRRDERTRKSSAHDKFLAGFAAAARDG